MMSEDPASDAWAHAAAAYRIVRTDPAQADAASRLECAMKHMITASDPGRTLLRRVLHTRSSALLRHLADIHGVQLAQIAADRGIDAQINDLFLEGAVDILSLARNLGIATFTLSATLVSILTERANRATLAFALADHDLRDWLLGPQFNELVIHADAGRAAALAPEIRSLPPDHLASLADHAIWHLSTDPSLKLLSTLVAVGTDFSPQIASGAVARLPKPLQGLASRTASVHGRLGLAAEEPSLESILARDARHGRFFGLSQSDIDRIASA